MFGKGNVNVLLLALCQSLAQTGTSILVTTASLVGYSLASDKALATVPVSMQVLGTMVATIPASLLMARIGRRGGFTVGTVLGAVGAATATLAIFRSSLLLFCLGTGLLGLYNGFALFYRFAAADTATPQFRPKAISLVLAGGVIAAVFGPEMAKWSRAMFSPVLFAGCYVAICGLCLAAMMLVQFIRIPRPPAVNLSSGGRPIGQIMRQPAFIAAALGGMIGYGVMSLVMTATPLAMVACDHSFADAAFVIQWHALGMYLPSFVTGSLIARFGVGRVMITGALLAAGCVAANLSGVGLGNFWFGLVLLGVGWNFLYVGGSTLLTSTYRPEEKAKTQAANDFLVFGMVSLSSFSSGALLSHFGWMTVNLAVVPLLVLVLVVVLGHVRRTRVATPA